MGRALVRTISEIALILFFFLIIWAPPLRCILYPHRAWSNTEKRGLAVFPERPNNFKTLLQFPEEFEAYYNDHFGFRDKLIHRYNRELEKRFGQSGVPSVLTGKDGWYFLSKQKTMDDVCGFEPLTEQQIISWKEDLVHKRDWLAKQGIHYLYVVGSAKPTIYPEYLPDYIQKAKGMTRLEQMMQYLGQYPDVGILDLGPTLIKAKLKMRPFHKTDTHWNDYGAFIAYREIVDKLSKWFPEERFKYDFYFHDNMKECPGNDLAVMLGLHKELKEMHPVLKDRTYCAQPMELHLQIGSLEEGSQIFMRGCKDANLRAVVFRDSFFNAVEPYFSENFQQVVYLWQSYDQEIVELLIESFDPHVVIEERAERHCFEHLY